MNCMSCLHATPELRRKNSVWCNMRNQFTNVNSNTTCGDFSTEINKDKKDLDVFTVSMQKKVPLLDMLLKPALMKIVEAGLRFVKNSETPKDLQIKEARILENTMQVIFKVMDREAGTYSTSLEQMERTGRTPAPCWKSYRMLKLIRHVTVPVLEYDGYYPEMFRTTAVAFICEFKKEYPEIFDSIAKGDI